MTRAATRPKPTHPKFTNLMTLQEVLTELGIAKSTWNEWRADGRAPKCIKLPNGQLRVRRSVLETWLERHEEVAA